MPALRLPNIERSVICSRGPIAGETRVKRVFSIDGGAVLHVPGKSC